jgi:dTMP kinase
MSRPGEAVLWVSFEGIEGSGKSTQVARLADTLRARGLDPLVTREPGGTELGRRLRDLLLRPSARPMDPTTELLLYAADRAQHMVEVVMPALAAGRIVLCDRHLDATLAYQGYGRGLGTADILALHRRPPLDRRPDLTLLLDLDPEDALPRARRRNEGEDLDRTEGRFEREAIEFHRRVRHGYLELAALEPHRFRVVDAVGDPDSIALRVRHVLADRIPGLGEDP